MRNFQTNLGDLTIRDLAIMNKRDIISLILNLDSELSIEKAWLCQARKELAILKEKNQVLIDNVKAVRSK